MVGALLVAVSVVASVLQYRRVLGEARDLKESGAEVWWVLIVALIIVYRVLAAQFESLIHPLTVMLAVPLAYSG